MDYLATDSSTHTTMRKHISCCRALDAAIESCNESVGEPTARFESMEQEGYLLMVLLKSYGKLELKPGPVVGPLKRLSSQTQVLNLTLLHDRDLNFICDQVSMCRPCYHWPNVLGFAFFNSHLLSHYVKKFINAGPLTGWASSFYYHRWHFCNVLVTY